MSNQPLYPHRPKQEEPIYVEDSDYPISESDKKKISKLAEQFRYRHYEYVMLVSSSGKVDLCTDKDPVSCTVRPKQPVDIWLHNHPNGIAAPSLEDRFLARDTLRPRIAGVYGRNWRKNRLEVYIFWTLQSRGDSIAQTLGVTYNGPQFSGNEFVYFVFTDPVTRSSFTGTDLESTRSNLEALRKRYEPADQYRALFNKLENMTSGVRQDWAIQNGWGMTEDSAYRALFSSTLRNPLKRGETWRGRAMEFIKKYH